MGVPPRVSQKFAWFGGINDRSGEICCIARISPFARAKGLFTRIHRADKVWKVREL
jgi:hypothetical protein